MKCWRNENEAKERHQWHRLRGKGLGSKMFIWNQTRMMGSYYESVVIMQYDSKSRQCLMSVLSRYMNTGRQSGRRTEAPRKERTRARKRAIITSTTHSGPGPLPLSLLVLVCICSCNTKEQLTTLEEEEEEDRGSNKRQVSGEICVFQMSAFFFFPSAVMYWVTVPLMRLATKLFQNYIIEISVCHERLQVTENKQTNQKQPSGSVLVQPSLLASAAVLNKRTFCSTSQVRH